MTAAAAAAAISAFATAIADDTAARMATAFANDIKNKHEHQTNDKDNRTSNMGAMQIAGGCGG